MKITASRDSIVKAVAIVGKTCDKNAGLPLLSGIKITAINGKLIFETTNLIDSSKYAIDANMDESGIIVVPGEVFSRAVKNMPDAAITIETNENAVVLKYGRTRNKINVIEADNFPSFPEIDASQCIRLSLETLKKAIKPACLTSAKNEANEILSGVLLEVESCVLTLVSTDSYRMCVQNIDVSSSDFSAVIPAKTLANVQNLTGDTVEISMSENQIQISDGRTVLITRKVEGSFPNWRSITSNTSNAEIITNASELIDAVKHVSATIDLNNKISVFNNPDESLIKLRTFRSDVGESTDSVHATINGEWDYVVLNAKFIVDAVSQLEGDITIEIKDSRSPVFIRCLNGDIRYFTMIMPMVA